MRLIVELHHTATGVEGSITPEGTTETWRFSSWLELLKLLEPPVGEQVDEC